MAPTDPAEISLYDSPRSDDHLEAFWKDEIKLIPLLNGSDRLPDVLLEGSKNAIFLFDSPRQQTPPLADISPVLSEHSYSIISTSPSSTSTSTSASTSTIEWNRSASASTTPSLTRNPPAVYPVRAGLKMVRRPVSTICKEQTVGSVLRSIYSNLPISRTPRIRRPNPISERTPAKNSAKNPDAISLRFAQNDAAQNKLRRARENLIATTIGTQPKLSARQEFLALASEQGSPLPKGCRADNSLLVLTQKFLDLLLTNQLVNLNEAADMLKVPKRRLYDITNVLDGIDMINKAGKNSISLKNPARARQMMTGNQVKNNLQRNQREKREKRETLRVKSGELDQIIASLESAVKIAKESPVDRTYCYVRNEDLRRATGARANGADDQTLIAVKLPFATHYDVTQSNFSETNRHSCLIRNREGHQIKVTLLPNSTDFHPSNDFAVPQLPPAPVKLETDENGKNFPLLSDPTLSAALPSAHRGAVGTIEQFNYDTQEPCSSRAHSDEVVMPTPGILSESSMALPLVTPSKLFSPGTASLLISPLKTLLDHDLPGIHLTPGPFSFDDHASLPLPHLTPGGTGATLDMLYDDSVWQIFDRNSQDGL